MQFIQIDYNTPIVNVEKKKCKQGTTKSPFINIIKSGFLQKFHTVEDDSILKNGQKNGTLNEILAVEEFPEKQSGQKNLLRTSKTAKNSNLELQSSKLQ